MKPILLKVAGLQSYRETQEIDFTVLTETGLFGIFGPTGSGKSSLLDAITLAMYGKVERAVNGTQGIMNHAEDSLSVAFTFELVSAEGTRRFRVERRFKRNNEVSVSNTISKFIETVNGEEQVLADKLADVNRCVEDVIGLKMDDFTRAVVLPQGKFAEFLSLKGSERRQMLQRLFHLEKYGDQLAIKLSRRVKDNDMVHQSLAAEQQGLGNASKETLAETELLLQAAVKQSELSRKMLDEAMKEAEQLGKVRELSQERQARMEEHEKLKARAPQIDAGEQRLKLAGAADAILPSLQTMRDAAAQQKLREDAAGIAHQQAVEHERLSALEAEKAEMARVQMTEEEPKLLLRLEQLEQAKELQRERDGLREERTRLKQLLDKGQAEQGVIGQQLEKEKELQLRGRKRREELQESLKPNEVRSEERRQLQAALELKHRLDTAVEQLRQNKAEMEAYKQSAEQGADRLKLAAQEESRLSEQRQQLIEQAATGLEALLACEQDIGREQSLLAGAEEQLRGSMREQEMHRLSSALRAELRDGEPCPVCGSAHHPLPAAPPGESPLAGDADLELLRSLHAELQELRFGLRQQLHERRSLLTQLGAAAGEAPAAAEAAPAAAEPESAGSPAHGRSPADWAERAAALREAAQALAAAAAPLQAEAAALQQAAVGAQQRRMEAAAAQEAGQAGLAQAERRLAESEAAASALHGRWAAELPGIAQEQAMALHQAMQERDARAEDIKERLNKSVTFLEEKEQLVQSLQQKLVELDKQLIQWQTEWQGNSKQLAEKEERLYQWVGEQRVEDLIAAAQTRLDGLRKVAADSVQRFKEADALKQESAKKDVMAHQAAASAAEHLQQAQERWKQLLDQSPFESENAVVEAAIPSQEAERLAAEIQDHRERDRELVSQLRELEQKLGGAVVSEEQWLACTERLQLSRAEDEAALRAKARAERDLEDLQQRHVRWTELENKRVEVSRQGEMLSKLQAAFRGNAFVEYIAEEQLMQVSQAASQRLRFLTKQRYSLEVDSGGGFVICDDANGGVKRPVSTLSGGETFLTSLSLALALSAQIQLRGQYPLQFFFLDEGFGTLDPELLDTVITSLEKLHDDRLAVGIISHVPELRARLPRKLVVIPAGEVGAGSRVVLETL
ncbi:SbcC/MukB-like Walker B domain-containing protein [Paenibacillus pabuli]|uniref:SbcC/MukB-like Walker B domain-containing protein n=1 Tax=Paenibacillus pabuli TaxID=1472 RepID=UPI001FFE9497|nr:SbcC/MukB-like Walker B domain-containing protein [Paenibacillus pabuli]UPK42337.1 AAA family ATPase [Paenibacillus pabuli]